MSQLFVERTGLEGPPWASSARWKDRMSRGKRIQRQQTKLFRERNGDLNAVGVLHLLLIRWQGHQLQIYTTNEEWAVKMNFTEQLARIS
jgi:hypothetical protein